jgi:hypothetical protein
MKEQFVIPAKFKITSYILIAVGILTLLIGIFALNGPQGDIRFWAVLVFNGLFFLLISVAITFLMCAATLAQGSWYIAYKRVMEAIIVNVPVFGSIAFIIMMIALFGHKHVYKWVDASVLATDKTVASKTLFLNPTFFTIMTVITIGVWSLLGLRMRRLSLKEDKAPKGSTKMFWKAIVVSAIFIVFYAITSSISAWHWILSIDADWKSTMFGWYVFASSFVCGISMLTLFVIALKNSGYLQIVNKEHLHDLGKFMFAFSIFWTYIWFVQYMLFWYGNIAEETAYFHTRLWGAYRPIFLLLIGINFIMPILILMTRDAKRSYSTVTFMAIVIFCGHWLDFYQMVMPSTVGNNWHIGWFEIGISAGFIGLMILMVSRALSRAPMYPMNHPYIKEAVIHQS